MIEVVVRDGVRIGGIDGGRPRDTSSWLGAEMGLRTPSPPDTPKATDVRGARLRVVIEHDKYFLHNCNNLEWKSAKGATKASAKGVAAQPQLLSGGNPQIPKGDGDAPVQAYIAAMPE